MSPAPGRTVRALVSLGSNVEREQNLPAAVELLAATCSLIATSRVWETRPVGTSAPQDDFFNAAVVLETALDAAALKREVLGEIERRLGRRRTGDRNAPRTIDADITLFGDLVATVDGRPIPDPDLLVHPHVALPAAEAAPALVHPVTGETLAAIARRLAAGATGVAVRDDVELPGIRPRERPAEGAKRP